jgi:hypothetical protein
MDAGNRYGIILIVVIAIAFAGVKPGYDAPATGPGRRMHSVHRPTARSSSAGTSAWESTRILFLITCVDLTGDAYDTCVTDAENVLSGCMKQANYC